MVVSTTAPVNWGRRDAEEVQAYCPTGWSSPAGLIVVVMVPRFVRRSAELPDRPARASSLLRELYAYDDPRETCDTPQLSGSFVV